MRERCGGFQFFKDVSFETDKSLKKHYSEKGGHKARHDFQETNKKVIKITKEIPSKGVIFEKK